MSLEPMLWALKDSPVADGPERLILTTLAERADSDGTGAFPSKRSLAKAALCDEKTVSRKLTAMVKRGLIALGDQSLARYIEPRYRPKVYDLLIPCSWYSPQQLERVNGERQQKGLRPLTPAMRPDIAPAPERTRRSDFGSKRAAADDESPLTSTDGDSDSQSPLIEETENRAGGTESPGREDSQSEQGGLKDPRTTPVNLPGNHPTSDPAPDTAGVEPDGPGSGPGKPARKTTKREEEAASRAAKRAAKDAEAERLDKLAQQGAQRWWDHATSPDMFGPWTGSAGAFVALRGMIRRVLAAKDTSGNPAYTPAQIWAALVHVNRTWPSSREFQDALALAAGRQAPGRRPGPARTAYDDRQYQRSTEAPEDMSAEDIDRLLGRSG